MMINLTFQKSFVFTSQFGNLKGFSVIQILREINFGEYKSSETVVFAIFGALNFVNLVNFSLQKLQKLIKIKIQSLPMCENGRF